MTYRSEPVGDILQERNDLDGRESSGVVSGIEEFDSFKICLSIATIIDRSAFSEDQAGHDRTSCTHDMSVHVLLKLSVSGYLR
jgi:hypothetical protein